MKRHSAALVLVMAWPMAAQSQKDLLLELKRDVAALQEENRKTKASQDERLAVLYENLNKTFDLITRVNEKMAATEAATAESLRGVLRDSGAPARELAAKVDGMNDQFVNLGNALAEVNARLAKFDAKLEDMRRLAQATASIPPPPSGEKLFDDASRDYLAGNADLALKGFGAYLDQFSDAARAPDAHFFIGEIHVGKGDFENAVRAYDGLLTGYPASSKAANAYYMKGVALLKLERRADAGQQFRIVADKYPGTELAERAKDYLRRLAGPPSPALAQKKAKQGSGRVH